MDSDWPNLPEHLLDLVLKKANSIICSSIVCTSWHSVAMDIQEKRAHPMILIPTPREATWKIYDPINDQILSSQLRLPTNIRFCGYSKGWLIALNQTSLVISLINPSFRVKGIKKRENSIIDLPPIIPHKQDIPRNWLPRSSKIIKATISADPILNPNDCIIVIIHEPGCLLSFIRLNKDTTWTCVDRNLLFIEDVICVEGKMYAVGADGRLLSFDITTQSFSYKELTAQRIAIDQDDDVVRAYLVYFNEKEVLMVQRFMAFDVKRRSTTKFGIFKFNFDQCKWIEKKNLGDVALFIGDNISMHVIASNFRKCQPNSIYFNHDYDRYSKVYPIRDLHRDYGVYSIQDQSFSLPYTRDAKSIMGKKSRKPAIWIDADY